MTYKRKTSRKSKRKTSRKTSRKKTKRRVSRRTLRSKSRKTLRRNTKRKTSRKSPEESATLFNLGTKRKGKYGKMYIVVKTSNGIKRWQELKTKGLASEQLCKNKLKRKINFNMKKYEKGEWSSRSQAIAVSYSQIKKSHPICKAFFKN